MLRNLNGCPSYPENVVGCRLNLTSVNSTWVAVILIKSLHLYILVISNSELNNQDYILHKHCTFIGQVNVLLSKTSC